MQAGEIKVVLTLDNGQFTIQTQKAGQTIQELKKSLDQTASSTQALEKHFTGLYQKFHDTVRTASLLRFAMQDINDLFLSLPTAIIKTAAQFERMNTLMEGLSTKTGDSARALEAMTSRDYIIKMALSSPFDMKALTDSFVKFKSAGLDPVDGSMKGLVDSVARFGGTSETLHRASIAVQQMAGKGVISMEELRQQLGEAVPTAMATMARSAGVSMQELTNKVKTGTVEANNALRQMFIGMQIENYGASEKMMETWDGMVSQLKTRFQLFQLDVANAGFFDAMKTQLQDVIDLLSGSGAKSFANDFGRALADIVFGIRGLVDWIIKWKDEIKTIAVLMAAVFAGNKIAGMVDSFKQSSMMAAYKKGMEDVVETAKKEADLITLKRLQNDKMIADYEKSYAKEMALAKQAQANRVAQYDTEIAQARAHVAALKAIEDDKLRQQYQLNMKGNAAAWDAGGIDPRTETGRARIRILNDEAAAARAAASEAGAHAAAVARETIATNEAIAALERKRAALAAATVTGNANTAAIRQTVDNLKENVVVLNNQAKAVAEVSFGLRAMHGVMEAGRTLWNAFGGWVTIAIGVLATLGDRLLEYMNRWQRFREIVEETKKGIASEESARKLESRIDELDSQIQAKRKELSEMRGDSREDIVMDPATGISVSTGVTTRADLQAQLDKLLGERRLAQDSFNEQKRLMDESAANIRVEAEKRKIKREITAVFDAWKSANDQLEKDKLDALEKAQEGGKTLTQSQRKAIEDPFNKQLVANQKSAARSALLAIDNMIAQTRADLARADIAEDTRKSLVAKLTALNDDKLGLRKEIQKLSEDAEKYLGAGLKITEKDKGDKPEDPLVRYVAGLEADLAKARVRLQANIDGVRDLASLRNEAVIEVMGKMASGSFDKPLDKDANDVQRRQYAGDQQARKTAIKDFINQMAQGQPDVDKFIDSLKGLDNEQRKLIRNAIEYIAQITIETERKNALNDAQRQATRATEDANAAILEYESQGMAKVSAGMVQMQKHFAALESKLKSVKGDFEAFNKEKAKAFAEQSVKDSAGVATEMNKNSLDLEMANIKATQSASEAREAEHQRNLRRIKEREEQESATLFNTLSMEEQTAAERERIIEAMNRVSLAADRARAAENRRFYIDSNAGMIQLQRNWADSVSAMKNLTVSWSNQFIDYLAQATTGGKGLWKQMVRSMAMDLYKVVLKDQVGGLISGMFGSLGNTLSSAFGFSSGAGKRGENPASPLYVQDVSMGAGKDTFKEVKDKLSDTWTTLKDKMSEMYDSLKDTLSGLMDNLGEGLSSMWDGLSSAFSGMGGEGGGDIMGWIASFFEDGGVMTSKGSLSLKQYAGGGVANSPQLAMFGEGSVPEAYVPLPDGRSIPVTVNGAGGGQSNVQINITVNKDGDKTSTSGDDTETWKRVANRVRGVVMEELVVQQRPGGVLYK